MKYMKCELCGGRMRKIGSDGSHFGDPPTDAVRYYECPKDGNTFTHYRETNSGHPGLPAGVAEALQR